MVSALTQKIYLNGGGPRGKRSRSTADILYCCSLLTVYVSDVLNFLQSAVLIFYYACLCLYFFKYLHS
jgi:hypothetical protein